MFFHFHQNGKEEGQEKEEVLAPNSLSVMMNNYVSQEIGKQRSAKYTAWLRGQIGITFILK